MKWLIRNTDTSTLYTKKKKKKHTHYSEKQKQTLIWSNRKKKKEERRVKRGDGVKDQDAWRPICSIIAPSFAQKERDSYDVKTEEVLLWYREPLNNLKRKKGGRKKKKKNIVRQYLQLCALINLINIFIFSFFFFYRLSCITRTPFLAFLFPPFSDNGQTKSKKKKD